MKIKTRAKSAFSSSLEAIYKPKNTSELLRIFQNRLEYYKIQAGIFGDSLVRYKYLEMLKMIRKELYLRGVNVEIFS